MENTEQTEMQEAQMSVTVAQKMSAARMLTAARMILRDQLPYFKSALFGTVYRAMPGLGTYAMSASWTLLYDPAVVERETLANCAASLMHEIMHNLRDHSKRCKAGFNPQMWNYAADAEINDDIRDMGLTLPDECVWASSIQGSDGTPMADGNIAEVYYAALRNSAQKAQSGGADGAEVPKAGAGWCGGCAGRPNPKEGAQGSPGGEAEGRSEAEGARIRKSVAAAAVKHVQTKGRGSVPAGFLAWAEAEIQPPKVDWRQKLSAAIRSACAYRAGAVTTTWSGFGRKQAALGFGAGRPMTPRWRNPVPRVTVIVDTSGSMMGDALERAAAEVAGILKAVNSTVTIVACDAEVHAVRECATWQEAVREFKGGGGTDMRPAVEAVTNTRGKLPAEVLVCLTDGYIGDPGPQPPGVKMIWVVIGRNAERPAPWGDVIHVDDNDNRRAA